MDNRDLQENSIFPILSKWIAIYSLNLDQILHILDSCFDESSRDPFICQEKETRADRALFSALIIALALV